MALPPAPGPARTASATPPGIRTLVFDVLGTVVDEAGSITAETAAALAAAGADPGGQARLAEEWSRRLDALTGQVGAGEAAWRSNDALRRAALQDAASAIELDGLPAGILDGLALVGHRLGPWPDSGQALRTLAGSFTVVALSNADLAQLADMSAAGGLAWHCVLSAELVKTVKPDPAVYRMALDLLGLNPSQTMMVAAHPWDLRAAAQHGMRTAYIARPGEGVPAAADRFDVYANDLAELAQLLCRPGTVRLEPRETRRAAEGTGLEGDVRDRARGLGRQADRAARRLPAGQRDVQRHQPGAAADPVQPQVGAGDRRGAVAGTGQRDARQRDAGRLASGARGRSVTMLG